MYYRARFYDPEIGRFTTPDPLTGGPDDPTISYKNNIFAYASRVVSEFIDGMDPHNYRNQYVYCTNNPINLIDPLGLRSDDQESDDLSERTTVSDEEYLLDLLEGKNENDSDMKDVVDNILTANGIKPKEKETTNTAEVLASQMGRGERGQIFDLDISLYSATKGVKSLILTFRFIQLSFRYGQTPENPISRRVLSCYLPWQ